MYIYKEPYFNLARRTVIKITPSPCLKLAAKFTLAARFFLFFKKFQIETKPFFFFFFSSRLLIKIIILGIPPPPPHYTRNLRGIENLIFYPFGMYEGWWSSLYIGILANINIYRVRARV